MADILQITEDIPVDDSIYDYEYKEYNPIAGKTGDLNRGSIVIVIEAQDIYTHPAESFLIVEGKLVKNDDGSVYDANTLISLINNGIMYLFSDVRYHLASHEIEVLQNPGHATTILGMLKFPDDFSKSQGLNQCWIKDTGEGNTVIDGNNPNDGFKLRRNYIINMPASRYCDIGNIYITLNAKRYPDTDYDIKFGENRFCRIYGDSSTFRKKFYNMDELVSNHNINPVDYKNLYPIFVFDVTKQSEKLKTSVSDIHVKMRFNTNPALDDAGNPRNVMAYAVIISDRLFHFVSDGSKITNIV